MRDNFDTCLQTVLRYEGGKVDDPRDPGGRTAFGITQTTYNGWRAAKKLPAQDVFNITQGEVAMIYRQNYWDKINGDNLPDGVDIAVFDFAVNSGVSRAAKYLQSTVGVTQDGVIGPATILAVKTYVANKVTDKRMGFLKGL